MRNLISVVSKNSLLEFETSKNLPYLHNCIYDLHLQRYHKNNIQLLFLIISSIGFLLFQKL